LFSLVDNEIIPVGWDIMKEVPHITVGYIDKNENDIVALLSEYPLGPLLMVDAIEISFCGDRGSCFGAIKFFELIGKPQLDGEL
jgi:hypothetical protein